MDPMEEGLTRFVDLAQQAHERGLDATTPPDPEGIVLVGMGGSGAAGGFLEPWTTLPTHIVRSERAPAFDVSGHLVVATSYSGETMETLTATRALRDRGAHVITVGTGGRLRDLGHQHVAVPEGFPPRAAFGALLGGVAGVLEAAGALPKDTLTNAVQDLPDPLNDPRTATLADGLRDPVIALAHDPHHVVPIRFSNQLHENAEIVAMPAALPEACHNLCVALGSHRFDGSVVLFEAAATGAARIRLDHFQSMCVDVGTDLRVVKSPLKGLAATLDLTLIGDAATLIVTEQLGRDAHAIRPIDALKESLHADGV